MKKIILSAVILLIFGCNSNNSGSSDPKRVLISFLEALGKKDIEGAKKLATKDSEGMLGMIQMGMSMAPDSARDKIFNKNNMEFGEVKIEGDKATVPSKNKNSGEAINFFLKKEDGAWKVAFDLGTMMEMGKEKMREKGMDMNKVNKVMDSASKMLQGMSRMLDSTNLKDTSR